MLVRWYIVPVTRQCAPTGVPATVKVPAAMASAVVIVVFANEKRVVKSVHEPSDAPVAGVSCGITSSSLLPQAASRQSSTALAGSRGTKGLIGLSPGEEVGEHGPASPDVRRRIRFG